MTFFSNLKLKSKEKTQHVDNSEKSTGQKTGQKKKRFS